MNSFIKRHTVFCRFSYVLENVVTENSQLRDVIDEIVFREVPIFQIKSRKTKIRYVNPDVNF